MQKRNTKQKKKKKEREKKKMSAFIELRSMFKELRRHHVWQSKPFRTFIRKEINQNMKTKNQVEDAKEYLFLLKSIREQSETFKKFNIGTFLEDRERIEKASKRVGLRLPTFADQKPLTSSQVENQQSGDSIAKK